jgi:hypothetical protein
VLSPGEPWALFSRALRLVAAVAQRSGWTGDGADRGDEADLATRSALLTAIGCSAGQQITDGGYQDQSNGTNGFALRLARGLTDLSAPLSATSMPLAPTGQSSASARQPHGAEPQRRMRRMTTPALNPNLNTTHVALRCGGT